MPKSLNEMFDKIINKKYNIDEISYNKETKSLKFFLLDSEKLNSDEENSLKTKLKEMFPYLDNVEFVYKPHETIEIKSIIDVWADIIDYVCFNSPACRNILTNVKRREYKNELIITFNNEFEKDLIINNKFDLKIKSHCKAKYSKNILLKFIVDEEENLDLFAKERNEKISKMVKKSVKVIKNEISADGKTNSFVTVVYKKMVKGKIEKISDVEEEGKVTVQGKIFDIDKRILKGGKFLITISITDYTDSIAVKLFLTENEFNSMYKQFVIGQYYSFQGNVRYDNYGKELVLFADAINKINRNIEIRSDKAEKKRVELHLHTNMSDMDAMTPVSDLINRAIEWGHSAIAITDHGGIQAFPEAMNSSEKKVIKVIYGVEGYIYDSDSKIIDNPNSLSLDQEFVVFDIETTGFSPTTDKIIEIGAVKIKNKKIVETFNMFVNPEMKIPSIIIELTGITNKDVDGEPTIEYVLGKFLEFVKDIPVVAHNSNFDVGFIKYNCKLQGLQFKNIVIDTLKISRILLKNLKRHKLTSLIKHYGIIVEDHHRALDDAIATAKVFIYQMEELERRKIFSMDNINNIYVEEVDLKSREFYHCIILVKNQIGLKKLFKLISESHIKYFYKKPRISKSLLNGNREDLLIGSACDSGEIYQMFLKGLEIDDVLEVSKFYDYFEVQPIENSMHLLRNGYVKDEEELKSIVKKIIKLGELTGKLVVATGDVHFLEPDDAIYRKILMAGQKYKDIEQPPLHYKTTGEMINDFSFLDEDIRNKIVVDNTNLIADMIDKDVKPVPSGTYPPKIEGSEIDLRKMCYENATNIYGENLPEIVVERLEKELNSIISNGYAVMYIIAQKLVNKSNEDGYIVGSRGSVGSSLVATMSGITEVNPLPPHYICNKCSYSSFFVNEEYGSGIDLPDKDCPNCNSLMKKDGHNIPFEVFLGFDGNKEPDIDLNFAGVYQAKVHKYAESLFGQGYVYRAGTIGTIADKTAYGFVKNYFEDRDINVSKREVNRLVRGCTGVKRTTGQHPGGIIVIPKYKEIHDFTPIQYPANDNNADCITTHFDYHALSGRIFKLDILGHDVPTIIKQLENLTGIDIKDVPLDDKKTISIFTSIKELNILDKKYNEKIGSFGIPEFGTKFVRQMLEETNPTTFAELIRISGLSHGTDVWTNNAQELVKSGKIDLKRVISTRDDIMNYLIYNGIPSKEAFSIMERVRNGKGLTTENISLMDKHKIPNWYIESCNKISYMFPKAHAVAYVMMSFRIAYFKVHYPLAFYATYFTSKVSDFDGELVTSGKINVSKKMKELKKNFNEVTKKEQDLYTVLEVVNEMYSRGYEFIKADIYESHNNEFKIKEGKLLLPLQALTGVGVNAAMNIYKEGRKKEFISIEDLTSRTKVTKTVIESLKVHGCLDNIPQTNQLQFF